MRRRLADQRGFTLVELMVVLVILGILIALSTVTFARVATRARRAEAKATIRTAMVAEQTFHGENSGYGDSSDPGQAATLIAFDNSIEWESTTWGKGVTARVPAGDDDVVVLRVLTRDSEIFCMGYIADPDPQSGPHYARDCTGTEDRVQVGAWDVDAGEGWK